jgi:uncharacterized protein involved in exopolysaccharide biosynthesis
LLGKRSEAHPLVIAARAEEQAILHQLDQELENAIEITEVELRLAGARVEALEANLEDVEGRFDHLAALRSEYGNLVAETENRTSLLERARSDLADARARQAAARSASLIAQIDAPDTGTQPVGPSRAMIVLFGIFGGLVVGGGVLFLSVEIPVATEPQSPAKQDPCVPCETNGDAKPIKAGGNGHGNGSLAQWLSTASRKRSS